MEKDHHHQLLNQCDDGRGTIPSISAWNSSILGMEMNPTDYFYNNSNWGEPSSLDHQNNDPFESALSSIVSSPVASTGIGNGLVIRELIGRLGSICNSGEVSPQSRNINNGSGGGNSSAHNTPSCYHTPLNSPPKLHLETNHTNTQHGNSNSNSHSQFPGSFLHLPPGLNADPGFADRAARLSAFGSGNIAAEFGMLPKLEIPGNLFNNQSNGSLSVHERTLGGRILTESGDSREGSSVSELNPAGQSVATVQNGANSRKRKTTAKNAKQQQLNKIVGGGEENDESPNNNNTKRIKQDEDSKQKDNTNNVNDNSKGKTSGDDDGDDKHKSNGCKESAKTQPEPPKDYIHVRARRGQATDSHSLAERVRREKISERMKFLQDLVPGCNKVTGKAIVLDEIINYVQSLQRQVEFLSMKLATVNPRLEFNMESLPPKDSFHSHNGSTSFPSAPYPLLDSTTQALQLPYGIYTNGTPFSSSNNQNPSIQMPSLDGFHNAAMQVAAAATPTAFGSDDLHSIVQMGFLRNQTEEIMEAGRKEDTAMKIEL